MKKVTIDEKELTVLRNKARVLDYIASQSKGSMAPLIFHWYPTPPEDSEYPDDVEPFTTKDPCTCFDVMGYLDPGEHFPECPKIGIDGHREAPGFSRLKRNR